MAQQDYSKTELAELLILHDQTTKKRSEALQKIELAEAEAETAEITLETITREIDLRKEKFIASSKPSEKATPVPVQKKPTKRTISPTARKRMSAAQKKRWAQKRKGTHKSALKKK